MTVKHLTRFNRKNLRCARPGQPVHRELGVIRQRCHHRAYPSRTRFRYAVDKDPTEVGIRVRESPLLTTAGGAHRRVLVGVCHDELPRRHLPMSSSFRVATLIPVDETNENPHDVKTAGLAARGWCAARNMDRTVAMVMVGRGSAREAPPCS